MSLCIFIYIYGLYDLILMLNFNFVIRTVCTTPLVTAVTSVSLVTMVTLLVVTLTTVSHVHVLVVYAMDSKYHTILHHVAQTLIAFM